MHGASGLLQHFGHPEDAEVAGRLRVRLQAPRVRPISRKTSLYYRAKDVRGRVDNVDTLPGGLLRAEMVRSVILLLCLAGFAAAQNTSTAPAGKYPALNIQVTVRTQEKSQSASFYR